MSSFTVTLTRMAPAQDKKQNREAPEALSPSRWQP